MLTFGLPIFLPFNDHNLIFQRGIMSNVARITYLPVELLNLLHQAESESKYTQFVTNKLLENTSLRESEQEKLIRYRRVLSHKEASRRFQVLTVSLRRIVSGPLLRQLFVVFFRKCRFYFFLALAESAFKSLR